MLAFSMFEMKQLQYLTPSSSIATRATDAQSEVRNLALPPEKKMNSTNLAGNNWGWTVFLT